MKPKIKKPKYKLVILFSISCFLLFLQSTLKAQDSTADNTIAQTKQREKPVKNTFRSVWIIDDQTVMVPVKGTFEIDIMHRFGTVQNGIKDMWGLFSTANIRLGASYVPINNLYLGLGLTKTKMLLDGSAKYAIIKQTKHMSPVSITYFGDMAYDTREDPNHILFKYGTERLSYFNELIFARKVSDKLSVQFAVGISHQNSVPGYYTQYDSTAKVIFNEEKFDLFSLAVSARYKITDVTSVIINYNQPITKFPLNNPHPNISFGFEFNTSGHTFQIFAANNSLLNPQQNYLYNKNNPFGYTQNGIKIPGGQFEIGFNITRLWNF